MIGVPNGEMKGAAADGMMAQTRSMSSILRGERACLAAERESRASALAAAAKLRS